MMRISKIISRTLLVIFGAGVVALAIVLVLIGFNLRTVAAVYSDVTKGKSALEQALNKAQSAEFPAAHQEAEKAVRHFEQSLENVKQIRLGPVAYIPLAAAYKTDAEHLVAAGTALARGMESATGYASDLGGIISSKQSATFSQLPLEERRRILAVIYNSDKTLGTVQKDLDESLGNLQAIKSFAWFGPLSAKLEDVKETITKSQKTLTDASPLTKLLPPLLGYPQTARYLLILQNSDELRPTGGFIGTYGIVQTKDGDFERFETRDIYHLDMPVKDKINIQPPAPIKKYLGVDKWYMRDANWAPDWPTSAEKILEFYKKENAVMPQPDPITDFDGVIAITPELITDLMQLTGPITIEGETYTPQNFVDLLQYKVEKGYIQLGVSSWHRKEVIGEIAKILKQRLLDLPLSRWPEMIKLVSNNVAKKNILLYARDKNLQKLIREQGWSGELRHDWGDYVMVVDANMAALKTDAVMDRQVNYQMKEENGKLKSRLVLRYSHGGGYDWKTSKYRTYTRVYVPTGSHLIKATGFSEGQVETGEEFGRTYFGAFLVVPAGDIAELVFEYELPNNIIDNMKKYNNYRLTIQKQPGKQVNKLTVDLAFQNAIKSYSPATFYSAAANPKELSASGDLAVDRSFFVDF